MSIVGEITGVTFARATEDMQRSNEVEQDDARVDNEKDVRFVRGRVRRVGMKRGHVVIYAIDNVLYPVSNT